MALIPPKPPQGTSNHELVWSYHNELRVYCTLDDGIEYTPELRKAVKDYKIELLEWTLGKKLRKLDDIVPHDKWDKVCAKTEKS